MKQGEGKALEVGLALGRSAHTPALKNCQQSIEPILTDELEAAYQGMMQVGEGGRPMSYGEFYTQIQWVGAKAINSQLSLWRSLG